MTASDTPTEASEEMPPLPADAGSGKTSTKRRSRLRDYVGNLLMFTASIAVTLVGAELLLRAFPQYQFPTGEGEYLFCSPIKARHIPHPSFGYTEAPGNSYFERYSTVDPWTYVHINDEGFRDNYDTHGMPVIVLGDSMTRGSLVNENETFTDVMDAWHPEWSFRNYGVGGYGEANSIRVYEDKAPHVPHKLVIQQFSLSTDIDDNVERAKLDGDSVAIKIKSSVGAPRNSVKLTARIHLFLWSHSKIYPWFYNAAIRPYFGNWDARRDMTSALEVTRRLLAKLASEAQSNNADLLLLVLPSWSEMAGRDDGMHPAEQRAMLEQFAASVPNAYLLDMTSLLAAENPDQTYGIIDKHLTQYGHFIVAEALERWFIQEWPRGPKGTAPARTFHANPVVIPECSRADAYLNLVKSPQPG